MPRPSKVLQLPPEVRQELDRELIGRGFADYEELAEWLEAKGYDISKSSLGRYGKDFKDRLDVLRVATAQAKEITSAIGDDSGALGDALTSLVQEKAFRVLMEMNIEDEDVSLDKLGTMIARLNKTSVSQKKWAAEVKERAAEAAADVDEIAREAGLTEETASAIRAKILGVAA